MEAEYIRLLTNILYEGESRGDRTGTGTLSLFAQRMTFDLQVGFPLLTTKRVPFKTVLRELLWFISGSTNAFELHPCHIWDEWAREDGDLGPIYGRQWRSWPAFDTHGRFRGNVDQLQTVVDRLSSNPECRRHIVCAWNVGQLEEMTLPPCHLMFQFYVRRQRFLDIQVYQRSCDMFLGVPFNIASYAALTHMIAHCVDLEPGILNWVGGDVHVYKNHLDACFDQLERSMRPEPKLKVHGPKDINTWGLADFELIGYDPHPPIKGDVSV